MKRVAHNIHLLEPTGIYFMCNFLWGINMIINNNKVKVFKIEHYMYEQRLSHNVLHTYNSHQSIARLEYFFMWRYETNRLKYMSFRANRNIY